MGQITLSVTSADGTFSTSASPDDSVIQEILTAVRTKFNISASSPQDVLVFLGNVCLAEINQIVTEYRTATVIPLKLTAS